MVQWNGGYVTDLAYTNDFLREVTPGWLALAALLQGRRPPALDRPFRYADLGCGNGFTATVVAATMPQAEVWGFDFNPAHIEEASRLAQAAALPNVHFREASFAELMALPERALPEFDFVVCHGVVAHVSAENRRLAMRLIARWLRPGGLAYLGYNVAVGWAGMEAVRRLVRMMAASPGQRPSDPADHAAWLDRTRTAGSLHFANHAGVAVRIDQWRQQDPRYFAHEYLGAAWQPLMFAEVADAMAEGNCEFIGSATMPENIDAVSLPLGCIPLLAEIRSPQVQETLRDFARAQSFRRDMYGRGMPTLPIAQRLELLDQLEFASLDRRPDRQAALDPWFDTIAPGKAIHRPVLHVLQSGRGSFRAMREAAAGYGQSAENALWAVVLLGTAGNLNPIPPGGLSPATLERSSRLNQALADAAVLGGELTQLVAPAIGAALASDLPEMLIVQLLARGAEPVADLVSALAQALRAPGRQAASAGYSVERIEQLVRVALDERLPILKHLGVLPPGVSDAAGAARASAGS